jgi:hypothetical protein
MEGRGYEMKKMLSLSALFLFTSCATIHFRSNQSIPITFEGNPMHQKEVVIEGRRDFFFWGNDPDFSVVFVDDEVKRAGFKALSKTIIYEHKNPQDILIAFLTLGIYMPKGYTITGYTEGGGPPPIIQPTDSE